MLDVCCGTGYLAGLLAARGFRVTGIDASPEMIALCPRRMCRRRSFMSATPRKFRVPDDVRRRGFDLRQPQSHPRATTS